MVVRLCDVSPTGSSLLVSRGFLNLTHRDSHENPAPLEPGKFYKVRIKLNVAGHRLPAGHCWGLAISPTYWPMAWPSPHPINLGTAQWGKTWLRLPVRHPKEIDENIPAFDRPEQSEAIPSEELRPRIRQRHIIWDIGAGKQEIHDCTDSGCTRLLDRDLEMYGQHEERYTIYQEDPLSARILCEQHMGLRREGWDIRIKTHSSMSADAEKFYVVNMLEAYEGKTRLFAKTWHTTIPRYLV